MNSLLYYYNNVQKMAAYRQAKRMQRGVKLGYQQRNDNDLSTQFISSPIAIGVNDFSIEFFGNTFGSSSYVYNTLCNKANTNVNKLGFIGCWSKSNLNGIDYIQFTLAGSGDTFEDAVSVHWTADSLEEKFLLTITRQGTTVKVYINGELKTTKEQSEVKDIGDLQLAIANSSEVGFVRVWNMCLSADDVTAHYNNGDPMGYVVPKAMRGLEPVEITGSNSYTWTGIDSVANVGIITNPNIEYGKFYVVNISVSDYEAGSPYLYIGYSYSIPKVNGNYNILIEHQYQSSNTILLFGGPDGTYRRLTLTVNSVTPVGLLAEYLPQNLMESRKGPAVEPKAKIYEFNIGDEYYKSVLTQAKYPYDCIYRVDYVVDEWDYQPKPIGSVGFLGLTGATILTPDGQDWSTLEKAKVGESRTLLVKMPGSGTPALYIYGGNDDETATARHLKVTIKGITPVSVPISWLDSAKQLPLSDEYMEPLFQSIGGYDMAANGAPEILYNE